MLKMIMRMVMDKMMMWRGGEDAQTDETISTMGIKVHGLGTFTNIFTSKINNISTEWPGRRKGVRDKILDIETEEVIREDGLGSLKEKGD